jgi:hypothetical protein
MCSVFACRLLKNIYNGAQKFNFLRAFFNLGSSTRCGTVLPGQEWKRRVVPRKMNTPFDE